MLHRPDFDKNFHVELLTTPNDRWDARNTYRNVDWNLIDDPQNKSIKYMRKYMFEGRRVPLQTSTEGQYIAYIWPESVHKKSELYKESYTNNISIATFLASETYNIFFPGDLQKEGMAFLLDINCGYKDFADDFVTAIEDGVDYLVAPHHGLRSSFSTELFDVIGKTRKLNIIPAKVYSKDDAREIDTRYQGSDFCEGDNNESTKDTKVYSHKTSAGHIYINDDGNFIQTKDIQEILDAF